MKSFILAFVFSVFSLACGSAFALAITRPDLTDLNSIFAMPTTDTIESESTFNCTSNPMFASNCTFDYRLSYVARDPTIFAPFEVTWAGINLTATLSLNRPTALWTSTLTNGVDVQGPANPVTRLTFRNINGFPNTQTEAEHYSHPSQSPPVRVKSVLERIGDAVFGSNTIEENPLLAAFNSRVELVGPGQYEYVYEVINQTDDPLMFDWTDLAESGIVAANDSLSWSVLSALEPLESYSSIDATVRGLFFSGPSTTLLPAPGSVAVAAPSTFSLGVLFLGWLCFCAATGAIRRVISGGHSIIGLIGVEN